MTEDRLRADQTARTGQDPVGSGSRRRLAAIVVVGRDVATLAALDRELSRRYRADYRIVVCGRPTELEPRVRELLNAGTPVALVIGGVGDQDPDGVEVLARMRDIDPATPRVAAVRWGDWETARRVFHAVTLGQISHWVMHPVQTPDEDFHHSVTGFLREWGGRGGSGFEAVQLIGERWSARSQELRDILSRNGIPIGFYEASSDDGRLMLSELAITSPELPVSCFGSEQSVRRWSTPRTSRSLTLLAS